MNKETARLVIVNSDEKGQAPGPKGSIKNQGINRDSKFFWLSGKKVLEESLDRGRTISMLMRTNYQYLESKGG